MPTPREKIRPAEGEDNCEGCGHWSSATEQGVDESSGYCDRWSRIVGRTMYCDEFVSLEQYRRFQEELVEENPDIIEDDEM